MEHDDRPGAGRPDGAARRVVALATGVGNFTEWFDFAIYGFLAATLGRLFFPGASPAASLLASLAVFGVAFFMRPLGGFVLAAVGDRPGRRALLTVSIGLMGVSTTLIGVLPTFVVVAAVATLALAKWSPEVGGRRLDARAAPVRAAVAP